MATYYIIAASPKGASSHINSKFKIWQNDDNGAWNMIGWKDITDVAQLIRAGHTVRTGKIVNNQMHGGAAVEIELRIAKNDSNYKISDMPDK